MRPWFTASVAVAFALGTPGPGATGPAFESHWRDGKAELDGYRLTLSRYGEERTGQAVMIFVTEPFSESRLVKVDDPSQDPADTFEAFKLNLVRDFQTGIYDYNTMVSVFARSADFSPAKITFTSAEWCGHVYEELLFHPGEIQSRLLSYFEGESSADAIAREEGGISEDNLFILLRGLRGDFLQPGESRTVPFLPGTFHRRLAHRPIGWTTARIERSEEVTAVDVPAGMFETTAYTVTTGDGRVGTFSIEREYPHRVIRWTWESSGADRRGGAETGELTGSDRLAYWRLHDEGDESYLQALGLSAD
jgi:hypothetical protein